MTKSVIHEYYLQYQTITKSNWETFSDFLLLINLLAISL